MERRFGGKAALVTGATNGIGRATADRSRSRSSAALGRVWNDP
jgi:NAD(P)-dependent dehydrogenase (short-subunit alcohol dehydrogenase family)